MKRLAIVLSLLAATVALTAGAQNQTDARLKRLFPAATTFSPKGGAYLTPPAAASPSR